MLSGGQSREYYFGTLANISSHYTSFEDLVEIDEIFCHPIFK